MKNTTNISRYGSHFPIQTVFVTNADGCGDHVFTQVKREGNVCIYSRTSCDSKRVVGFEVVVLKHVKAGSPLPGGNVVKADYESYPGSQAFGRTAWFCSTGASAEDRFEEVVKNHTEPTHVAVTHVSKGQIEESQDIPDGEFTQAQFATVNCMPVRGVVYNILKSLVDSGKVVVSRKEQRGPGRATVLYRRA